jgi:hypothetical protein
MKPNALKKEIKAEIKEVFDTLPPKFYGHALFEKVVRYIAAVHNKNIYSDTVLRYFREMRERGEIDCECLNRQDSFYQKTF